MEPTKKPNDFTTLDTIKMFVVLAWNVAWAFLVPQSLKRTCNWCGKDWPYKDETHGKNRCRHCGRTWA